MKGLAAHIAASHASLRRGRVWCRRCGETQLIDPTAAIRAGWPKCCGHTMTIDSPEEQAALAAAAVTA